VARRSHDALRARDRGRRGLPVADTAHHHDLGTSPHLFSRATLTAWLKRYHAHLSPPGGTRPYWCVYQGATYLAAGRSPHRAITNAMSSRYLRLPNRLSI
jgi:hypothetical protein